MLVITNGDACLFARRELECFKLYHRFSDHRNTHVTSTSEGVVFISI